MCKTSHQIALHSCYEYCSFWPLTVSVVDQDAIHAIYASYLPLVKPLIRFSSNFRQIFQKFSTSFHRNWLHYSSISRNHKELFKYVYARNKNDQHVRAINTKISATFPLLVSSTLLFLRVIRRQNFEFWKRYTVSVVPPFWANDENFGFDTMTTVKTKSHHVSSSFTKCDGVTFALRLIFIEK